MIRKIMRRKWQRFFLGEEGRKKETTVITQAEIQWWWELRCSQLSQEATDGKERSQQHKVCYQQDDG